VGQFGIPDHGFPNLIFHAVDHSGTDTPEQENDA
jgi:hypothetical protein